MNTAGIPDQFQSLLSGRIEDNAPFAERVSATLRRVERGELSETDVVGHWLGIMNDQPLVSDVEPPRERFTSRYVVLPSTTLSEAGVLTVPVTEPTTIMCSEGAVAQLGSPAGPEGNKFLWVAGHYPTDVRSSADAESIDVGYRKIER